MQIVFYLRLLVLSTSVKRRLVQLEAAGRFALAVFITGAGANYAVQVVKCLITSTEVRL